jgi:hypothetical protein
VLCSAARARPWPARAGRSEFAWGRGRIRRDARLGSSRLEPARPGRRIAGSSIMPRPPEDSAGTRPAREDGIGQGRGPVPRLARTRGLGDVPGGESNGPAARPPVAAGARNRVESPPGTVHFRFFWPIGVPIPPRKSYISCRAIASAARKGRDAGARSGRSNRARPDGPHRPRRRTPGSPGRANRARQPSSLGSRGAYDGRNQDQTDTRPGPARMVRATSPVAVRPIPGVPRRAGGADRRDVGREESLRYTTADDRPVPGPHAHRSGSHEPDEPALCRLPHGRGGVGPARRAEASAATANGAAGPPGTWPPRVS